MSDWQVGDLALCVDDSPRHYGPTGKECDEKFRTWEANRVYKVRRIAVGTDGVSIGLLMEEGCGGHSCRFRKIKPDAEPCEEEFTVLIKRMKPAKVKS